MKMCQYLSFGEALGCRSAPRGDVEVHCGVTLARHLSQWRHYLQRFMDAGPKKGSPSRLQLEAEAEKGLGQCQPWPQPDISQSLCDDYASENGWRLALTTTVGKRKSSLSQRRGEAGQHTSFPWRGSWQSQATQKDDRVAWQLLVRHGATQKLQRRLAEKNKIEFAKRQPPK